jgi:transposase, IS5 family
MVKSGTLIASLVEADGRRPRRGEPVEGRSDPDASWNAMPETPLFGYKAHLAVDPSSGLVRQALLTPANVSDKTPFLALVQGDEKAVYADKGYDGWWYRAELAARGIADGIMAGDSGRRPLDAEGHARNRAPGKLRAPVERSFAILKRWYGCRRVRYWSLGRNALQLQLLAGAMNCAAPWCSPPEGGDRLELGRPPARMPGQSPPHHQHNALSSPSARS